MVIYQDEKKKKKTFPPLNVFSKFFMVVPLLSKSSLTPSSHLHTKYIIPSLVKRVKAKYTRHIGTPIFFYVVKNKFALCKIGKWYCRRGRHA